MENDQTFLRFPFYGKKSTADFYLGFSQLVELCNGVGAFGVLFYLFCFCLFSNQTKCVILQNIFKLNICFLFWKNRNSFRFLAINLCVKVMREKVSINCLKRIQLHPRVQILSPGFIEFFKIFVKADENIILLMYSLTKQGYETGDGYFSEY